VLVAHTYNSSYRGGRDEEDCSLRPSQAKSSISTEKAEHGGMPLSSQLFWEA
jgi:hypothetical protein